MKQLIHTLEYIPDVSFYTIGRTEAEKNLIAEYESMLVTINQYAAGITKYRDADDKVLEDLEKLESTDANLRKLRNSWKKSSLDFQIQGKVKTVSMNIDLVAKTIHALSKDQISFSDAYRMVYQMFVFINKSIICQRSMDMPVSPYYIAIARPDRITRIMQDSYMIYSTDSSLKLKPNYDNDTISFRTLTENELFSEVLHITKLSDMSFADSPDVSYRDGSRSYMAPIVIFRVAPGLTGDAPCLTECAYENRTISTIYYDITNSNIIEGCYPMNHTHTDFVPDIVIGPDGTDRVIYAETGKEITDTIEILNGFGIESISIAGYSKTSVTEIPFTLKHDYGSKYYKLTYTPTTKDIRIKVILVRQIENFLDWEENKCCAVMNNQNGTTSFDVPLNKCVDFDAYDTDKIHAYSGKYDPDKDQFIWDRIGITNAKIYVNAVVDSKGRTLTDEKPFIHIVVDRSINRNDIVSYFMFRFVDGALFINDTRIQSQYDELYLMYDNVTYESSMTCSKMYHAANLPKVSPYGVSVGGNSNQYITLFGTSVSPCHLTMTNGDRCKVLLSFNDKGYYFAGIQQLESGGIYETQISTGIDASRISISEDHSVYSPVPDFNSTNSVQAVGRASEPKIIHHINFNLRSMEIIVENIQLGEQGNLSVLIPVKLFCGKKDGKILYNAQQLLIFDLETGNLIELKSSDTIEDRVSLSSTNLNNPKEWSNYFTRNGNTIRCRLAALNKDPFSYNFSKITAKEFSIVQTLCGVETLIPCKLTNYKGTWFGHRFRNLQTSNLPTETFVATFDLELTEDFVSDAPIEVNLMVPRSTVMEIEEKTFTVKFVKQQLVNIPLKR